MGSEESLKIAEEKFKERILNGMKENLIFSILSFLWNHILESGNINDTEKRKIEKDFVNFWKKNINEITQEQIKEINQILNDGNIDMLNIITGNKHIADVEDYQNIITSSLREVESIFWKICGKIK